MLARQVRQGLTGGRLAIAALALIFTGIPIWLWGGYWWGRFMALVFGQEPPSKSAI
jgi:hypothetical protein